MIYFFLMFFNLFWTVVMVAEGNWLALLNAFAFMFMVYVSVQKSEHHDPH